MLTLWRYGASTSATRVKTMVCSQMLRCSRFATVVAPLTMAKSQSLPTVADEPQTFAYLKSNSLRQTDAQKALDKEIASLPRGIMAGSPDEAQFIQVLLQMIGATRVLEVGVFRGSTTLAMALALPPGGTVVAMDIARDFCDTAVPYWRDAGVENKIDLRIGSAVTTLDNLIANGEAGTFDFAFIDADKVSYDDYYERCLKLVRVGGVVGVDNVLWHGKPVEPPSDHDADTRAIHALNRKIHADERVAMSMLPIADGLTLCVKLPPQIS
eukprot:TRINITY_DN51619_c0_g1_i1.p1 TRINITY_DN51619_c0_g1~~TRINITY_DN51619_c0_g1_i1.p1  ORF type:complete len:282 (+),score=35.74 TRINITY_DN51619_c0_g1_i1:41-847(+)